MKPNSTIDAAICAICSAECVRAFLAYGTSRSVGRNWDIPLFLVLDLEVELRLRPDFQCAIREVNVLPGEVDRLLIAQTALQQNLEDQIQMLVLDQTEEGPEFVGRVDLRYSFFILGLDWRKGLHVKLAVPQECSNAGMVVCYRAGRTAATTELPLVE